MLLRVCEFPPIWLQKSFEIFELTHCAVSGHYVAPCNINGLFAHRWLFYTESKAVQWENTADNTFAQILTLTSAPRKVLTWVRWLAVLERKESTASTCKSVSKPTNTVVSLEKGLPDHNNISPPKGAFRCPIKKKATLTVASLIIFS